MILSLICFHIFDIISLFAAELEEPKIGIWGQEITEIKLKTALNKTQSIDLYSATASDDSGFYARG